MFDQTDKLKLDFDEQLEFEFYLQWEWPEHIETSIRRLLWISLVEASESEIFLHKHTTFIRWQIATYPDAHSDVLDFLGSLQDPQLLTRVAENPQTSVATLVSLSASTCANVKIAVVDNPKTPVNVLKTLAADDCLDVRFRLAENPALPSSLLQQLAADENVYVAHRARKTIMRRNIPSLEHFPRVLRQSEHKPLRQNHTKIG